MIRILLTGIGAPGAYGSIYSLRKGADAVNVPIFILGTDISSNFPGNSFYDGFSALPPTNDPRYLESLNLIIDQYSIDVVIPQTTKEVQFLSLNKQYVKATVLVSSPSSISIANDKINTMKAFEDNGYCVPKYFEVSNIDDLVDKISSLGYPDNKVVVKLPLSNGMRGLRIVSSRCDSYNTFIHEKPDNSSCSLDSLLSIFSDAPVFPRLLVSEFLDGPEYTVDCLNIPSQIYYITRKRNIIRSGITYHSTIEKNMFLQDISNVMGKQIGLTGVFGFQYIILRVFLKSLNVIPGFRAPWFQSWLLTIILYGMHWPLL